METVTSSTGRRYRQPKILVLDEGTAHLDIDNERQINESLRCLAMTRISVAHRPEIISGADQIVHVDRTIRLCAPPETNAVIGEGRLKPKGRRRKGSK